MMAVTDGPWDSPAVSKRTGMGLLSPFHHLGCAGGRLRGGPGRLGCAAHGYPWGGVPGPELKGQSPLLHQHTQAGGAAQPLGLSVVRKLGLGWIVNQVIDKRGGRKGR